MTIGKIKLGYSGKNDLILSGNPQISFWKYAVSSGPLLLMASFIVLPTLKDGLFSKLLIPEIPHIIIF